MLINNNIPFLKKIIFGNGQRSTTSREVRSPKLVCQQLINMQNQTLEKLQYHDFITHAVHCPDAVAPSAQAARHCFESRQACHTQDADGSFRRRCRWSTLGTDHIFQYQCACSSYTEASHNQGACLGYGWCGKEAGCYRAERVHIVARHGLT